MSLYPRSLLRLVLLGNLLLLTPLVVTIIYAAIAVKTIAAQSELLADEANRAGQLSWGLPENLRHMERILRQYNEQGDAHLLNDYSIARADWRQRTTTLAQIPLIASLNPRIEELLTIEDRAWRYLGNGESSLTLHATVAQLLQRSLVIADEATQIVAAERASFREKTANLQDQLLNGIIAALVTVLALMLFWRWLMARLLSRVERAVQALGQGRLDRRIDLRGPDDLRRIGRRLEWLRQRLQDLEEQRTSVLRHVSHELKTPLTALREGSSLLADQVAGDLTLQQSRIVNIMHNNILRLQALIDSLLRLQRAEYILERTDRVQLQFDDIIRQVLATVQLLLRSKRLQIAANLAPLTVMGGKEEIMAVVNNLVTNAIKYSPAGSTITLLLAQTQDWAVFDVIDQGPGIPKQYEKKIFEPFFRVQETESSATGIGLGLAIAAKFVYAHQGSLELIDSPAGSHFQMRLPMNDEQES
jgi:two-component system sensor histidine kinase GlrK